MRNLSELLSNALVLAPLAILIFVRVFAKVLTDKKKHTQAKPHTPRSTPKLIEKFRSFITGDVEPAPTIGEPLDFEVVEKRKTEKPESKVVVEYPPEPIPTKERQAPEEAHAAPSPFPQTVERLSPLKKAIVMADILGTPKYFDY